MPKCVYLNSCFLLPFSLASALLSRKQTFRASCRVFFFRQNVCIFFPSLWINIFDTSSRIQTTLPEIKRKAKFEITHYFPNDEGGGRGRENIWAEAFHFHHTLLSIFTVFLPPSHATFRHSIEGFSSHVASFTVAWILINRVARRHKKNLSSLHFLIPCASRKMEFPFRYCEIKYSEFSDSLTNDEFHTFIDKRYFLPSTSHLKATHSLDFSPPLERKETKHQLLTTTKLSS